MSRVPFVLKVVSAVSAATAAAVSVALPGGVDPSEWAAIVVAFVSALGAALSHPVNGDSDGV